MTPLLTLPEAAAQANRTAAAFKGVATRMKNRVKVGVCPCCNRTFENLARHMKSKHPDIDNIVELDPARDRAMKERA